MQPSRSQWKEWSGEDWTGDVGQRIVVRLGPADVRTGVVHRLGAAPWDLHLLLDDGSHLYRGGDKLRTVPVRLLESQALSQASVEQDVDG